MTNNLIRQKNKTIIIYNTLFYLSIYADLKFNVLKMVLQKINYNCILHGVFVS